MDYINIEILNRTDVRRRDQERPEGTAHEYSPEPIPVICKGCTTKSTPQARPMKLEPGDVFSITHDASKKEITLTGERPTAGRILPIYFKLQYSYSITGLQPFEVTSLLCRLRRHHNVGITVDHLLKMLSPRQALPTWEPSVPLDRHTDFSLVSALRVGITKK